MDGVDNEEKFTENLKNIQERLKAEVLPVQFPIGIGRNLEGLVDVVGQKACYFNLGDKEKAKNEEFKIKEIPYNLIEKTKEYRSALLKKLEKIIEQDEDLLLRYVNNKGLTEAEIKKTIRKATLSGNYFPVFCGSAYKHVGVKLLLDGVIDYLPSPLDVPSIQAFSLSDLNKKKLKNAAVIRQEIFELKKMLNDLETSSDLFLKETRIDLEEKLLKLNEELERTEKNQITCKSPLPYLALAFKIIFDERNQRITFIRVYAGKISLGSRIYNVNKEEVETVSLLVRMHANNKENIKEVGAGDIAAILGLKKTVTGDTFCDKKNPLLLETISFAEPVISQAIEPKRNQDQNRVWDALKNLQIQDPSFKY
jgi:elongation factor G